MATASPEGTETTGAELRPVRVGARLFFRAQVLEGNASISPEKQNLKKTMFATSQENVFQSSPKTGIKNHPRRHIFMNSGPTFMIMFVAPVLTVRPFLNAPIRMGATCCGSPLHFGPCKKTKEGALGKKGGFVVKMHKF